MTVGDLVKKYGKEILIYQVESDDLINHRPPERFVLAGYVSGGKSSDRDILSLRVKGIMRTVPLTKEPKYIMVWV